MDKVYRVNNLLILERTSDGVDSRMIINFDLVETIYTFSNGVTNILLASDRNIEADSEWFEKIMRLWIEHVSYGR